MRGGARGSGGEWEGRVYGLIGDGVSAILGRGAGPRRIYYSALIDFLSELHA